MLFNFFSKPHSYAMYVDGGFSTVSPLPYKGSEYRYLPTVNNKKNQKCHLILNHQDYETAIVELPDLPENEIPQAIHWEAVKLLGGNETLLSDFYHLPAVHHDHKKMVNIVAVSKDYIEFIKDKAIQQHIHLNKITIPEIIYKDANLASIDNSRFCMVIANKAFGKVVIIEQGEVYFSRKFNLSFNDSLDEVDYESLVLLELQRSLDYCERQYRILMPTEFMLVGDGVNASLIERLKENFSLNINTKFPWDSALSEQQDLSSDHRFLLSASYL